MAHIARIVVPPIFAWERMGNEKFSIVSSELRRNVVVMMGRNKVVEDLEAAIERIKYYAAPVNAMRLNKKTPCAKTGVCEDGKSPGRICNSWTITQKSFPKGRIKVVLVNENLGL